MNATKIFHCLAFLLLWSASTSIGLAQSCLPEGITFRFQHEIDDFASQYPQCTEIEGLVLIDDNFITDITNLNGLSHLTSVGSLRIEECHNLVDLEGLSSLETIHGTLAIEFNNKLKSLKGLNLLNSIDGEILISSNDKLEHLGVFFEKMSSTKSNLAIQFNPVLLDVPELKFIEEINGDFILQDNYNLKNLDGLLSLKSINGDFIISNHPSLNSIEGLNQLQIIKKGLLFYDIDKLENLEGLSSLSFIGGDFNISYSELTSLKGLESLKEITSDLIISQNLNLINLEGFETLEFIGGNIVISRNSSLTKLWKAACFNLVGTESLTIHLNINLESLEGLEDMQFDNLSSIRITNNHSLKTCAIESLCKYISDGKLLTLELNSPECNDPTTIANTCEDLPVSVLNCQGTPFPNPSSDFLMLSCDCKNPIKIYYQIFDSNGTELLTDTFSHKPIDISMLTPGTYFIKFEGSSEIDLSFAFVKM